MRRYAVIFIAIFFIISFVATAAHAIKMNIDPSRIDIQVKAGKTANGFITVDNLETEIGRAHV